ncbi:Maff2 family mobile element protein [Fusobacterium necrophorum]
MGENPEITSKDYLSLSGAKSQGVKQLMAGGGIVLIGLKLIPLLANVLK